MTPAARAGAVPPTMNAAVLSPTASERRAPSPPAAVGGRLGRWGLWLLGLLLLAQGAGKVADPTGYLVALRAFALPWPAAMAPLAASWAAAELLAGAGLLYAGLAARPAARPARAAAWLALAVALAYAALTSQGLLRHLPVANCTCFGSYLAQPLGVLVLLQDAYVLAFTAWQLRRCRRWPGG